MDPEKECMFIGGHNHMVTFLKSHCPLVSIIKANQTYLRVPLSQATVYMESDLYQSLTEEDWSRMIYD